MDAETRRWLEIGALQLAVVVVATHLYYGLPRLVRQPVYATVVDPRPTLFVLSAMLLVAGAIYAVLGGAREPVYAGGILLMALFVLGYVWWHLTGHVGGLPWVEARPTLYHDRGPVATVAYHLRTDRLELVSKVAETALAALLAVLLYDVRATDGASLAGEGGAGVEAESSGEAGSGGEVARSGDGRDEPSAGGDRPERPASDDA